MVSASIAPLQFAAAVSTEKVLLSIILLKVFKSCSYDFAGLARFFRKLLLFPALLFKCSCSFTPHFFGNSYGSVLYAVDIHYFQFLTIKKARNLTVSRYCMVFGVTFVLKKRSQVHATRMNI